ITDDQIWNDNPEKVFGLREDFAEKYPATTAAAIDIWIWIGFFSRNFIRITTRQVLKIDSGEPW
ncbi:MAG: ABC transporter substrate-binding protein, partial [Cyanobacteria bacterium J06626_14]